ncbi:MAG TPA: nuclear transport factor 2 family protein [Anaerolineales bacterium]|jgi:predicted SnoaL-like aldol condensation-catalyzing enzyme|nr:nuclear transport factor 2 family protein [Anaerolineales bacterium]HQX17686.1 nuclear transport factor 2 family protein [Anaerolineales bacterium]
MTPTRMSEIESSVRAVMDFNDAFNRHDVQGMMQLTSDDTVFENTDPSPDGTRYAGKDAVTKFWQDFFRDAPNAHIDIEEIFGFGNRCVMRWTYTWGDGHIRGMDVFKLKDGLIAEKLSYVKG